MIKTRVKEDIIFPVLSFVVISIGLAIILDLIFQQRLDLESKAFGISIPVAGFISVIYTLIQNRRVYQRGADESTRSLFHLFTGDRFRAIRDEAWAVRNKWRNPGYKEAVINHAFTFNESFIHSDQVQASSLSKDLQAIYELMSFYVVLSQYEDCGETLRRCNCFYYGWWRDFLYEVAHEMDKNRTLNPDIKELEGYKEDISYLPALRRLDSLMGLDRIDRAWERDEAKREIKGIHETDH